MKFQRTIKSDIIYKLKHFQKAIIIYGPRQVGKTTLCKEILNDLNLKTLFINADEERFKDVLSSKDSRKLIDLMYGYDIVFIDEAQRINDIGINLKIIIDNLKDL
jgi:hypothetical protein